MWPDKGTVEPAKEGLSNFPPQAPKLRRDRTENPESTVARPLPPPFFMERTRRPQMTHINQFGQKRSQGPFPLQTDTTADKHPPKSPALIHSLLHTPKLRPISRHPNSRETSNPALRLGHQRKLGPPDKKRKVSNSETVQHTPHLLTRNTPSQLTQPKAGSPTRAGAFLPPGLGLGSRGAGGALRGRKLPGSFVWEKWEGPGGGGTERWTAGRGIRQ